MTGKIFVAGHRGLVGSAIVRALEARVQAGEPWEIVTRTRAELDLLDGAAVRDFVRTQRPEYVIVSAAKVGGIKANNDYPVEFLLDNLKIQNHLIESAYECGVRKLLFLGSSCIYPKLAPQPLHEDMLLTGALEPSNEAYAIAKIAGIKLCQAYRRQYQADFISAMPTNLYGPNDNFDLQSSHVLPALLHKFHVAVAEQRPSVTLWGTGSPRREFLHVDDLAAGCLMLLEKYSAPEIINIGTGEDVTIRELAELVREVVGYKGELVWDTTQLDGTPRKLLDISRIRALGWAPRISLAEGIASTYRWFLEHQHARGMAA
jgi:GDP-L-fucose synthase